MYLRWGPPRPQPRGPTFLVGKGLLLLLLLFSYAKSPIALPYPQLRRPHPILFFFTVSRASQINTRAPHKLVVGANFLFSSIGRLRSGGGCKLDHIITKERIRGSFAFACYGKVLSSTFG